MNNLPELIKHVGLCACPGDLDACTQCAEIRNILHGCLISGVNWAHTGDGTTAQHTIIQKLIARVIQLEEHELSKKNRLKFLALQADGFRQRI